MATLALRPTQTIVALVQVSPEAQGREGQRVRQASVEALRHWKDRAEVYLEEMAELDELSHVSLPLEKAFTIRVKYRYVGEMKPRCHFLDE
jgi:hypothetical protein